MHDCYINCIVIYFSRIWVNIMKRIQCILSYDGSNFSGYQVQPNKRTIQGELEEALRKIHKGTPIRVTASGRTDAGVHARGQVIHFDTELTTIPEEKWPIVLNTVLPSDIVILKAKEVSPTFHARFDAVKKEYRYFIYNDTFPDVFRRHYAYHFRYPLCVSKINEACQYLIGTHDFTSFCAANTDVEDKVRTIYEMECMESDNMFIFRFVGNGFLYNMVRILVGTLLQVGQEVIRPEEVAQILEKRNRSYAGKTAPAHGLYLWRVSYEA